MQLKKNILIVDDNLLNREMLVEILKEKYCLFQAENGRDALDFLRRKEADVDLILLDVQMPVMDGHAFLDAVKADEELSIIPVIVMTQGNSEEDEIAALMHGASDFVPKPYRPQIIYHRIESLLKLQETAATANMLRYDRLTGIYNNDYFFKKAHERLLEDPDSDYTIVCSNVENFSLYNIVYGAKEGDNLLKEIAAAIGKKVGPDGVYGRLGSDKFAYLQKAEKEIEDRKYIDKSGFNLNVDGRKIVIRLGVYNVTDRNLPVAKMCDLALIAAAGIKGKYNRYYAVYDDVMRGKLLREKSITDAMATALEKKQFTVYLQPKLNLRDEKITGAEALVRWVHPKWGMVSPAEFIPVFEKNGFIWKLDRYVWEEVCAILADWREKGYPLLPVSVNVSRVDLYRGDPLEYLCNLTEKYGVEPSLLHLEITESAYSSDQERIIETIKRLRAAGFVVEMDDFGSGYSSLNMLSSMKIDILKLDINFVRNETEKMLNNSILSDVINMAHRLRLEVVAEGVETRAQKQRLQAVGCDIIQGYFFAKPMPRADYEKMLSEQSCKPKQERKEEQKRLFYRVLVAEENQEYAKKLCGALEKDFKVIAVSDADGAINELQKLGSGVDAVVLSASLSGGGAKAVTEFMRADAECREIPVLATITYLTSNEGEAETATDDFLCKNHPARDILKRVRHLIEKTELYRRFSALQKEAFSDPLTGVLNRRGFREAFKAVEENDRPFAFCLFDLDDLKKINDTYGHVVGDKMIISFTDVARQSVGNGDIICRYGGDEFVLILRNTGDEREVEKKISGICRAVAEHFAKEGINSSCSCGILMCANDGTTAEDLLDKADEALYKAKKAGKGGCFVLKKGAES